MELVERKVEIGIGGGKNKGGDGVDGGDGGGGGGGGAGGGGGGGGGPITLGKSLDLRTLRQDISDNVEAGGRSFTHHTFHSHTTTFK